METVFAYSHYRDFLQKRIDGATERGALTRLAEAAKCQRSHISRVLSGQLHLTPEQAFLIARHLHLGQSESAYFCKLVDWERAGDAEYRAALAGELRALKREQENLSKRLGDAHIGTSERELLYYSSWYWSAIHVLVSIPEFQTVSAISSHLSLSPFLVEGCLRQLEKFELVKHEKGKWKFAGGSLHLSKDSPLNAIQHGNWRSRAVLDSQNRGSDGVHYTVVQSLSRKDFEQVKELVLSTIDKYSRIAKPSKEEELICFACDFFKV
jgi:uncharacterized protein (TIGR02147 family)